VQTPRKQRRPRLRPWMVWTIAALPFAIVLSAGVFCAVALPGCASCHVRGEFGKATKASSHASIACAACHVPKAPADRVAFGFREVAHMVVPVVNGRDNGWSAVPDENCLACHRDIEKGPVSARGLRIDHLRCTAGDACTDCHSSVAHGAASGWTRGYDMEKCIVCHVKRGSTKCNVCHEQRSDRDRVASGAFAVTHSASWRKTHGLGNWATCTVCHKADDCEECHGTGVPHDGKFIERHSSVATKPGARCSTCHEQRFCDSCHGLKMPHDKAFVRTHPEKAKADKASCMRCHVDSDCSTCHVTHIHPGGSIGRITGALSGGGR
jgi:hypothetical protein